jgi:hypothetical protein
LLAATSGDSGPLTSDAGRYSFLTSSRDDATQIASLAPPAKLRSSSASLILSPNRRSRKLYGKPCGRCYGTIMAAYIEEPNEPLRSMEASIRRHLGRSRRTIVDESLCYISRMEAKQRLHSSEPVDNRWLTIDEVRLMSDLRIMYAKVDELFQVVNALKQRHPEEDIRQVCGSCRARKKHSRGGHDLSLVPWAQKRPLNIKTRWWCRKGLVLCPLS